MISKATLWKSSALRLAGLAFVASAVIAAPLSAESKRDSQRQESPKTWAGGAGSVLFAVVGSSGKKGAVVGGGQNSSASAAVTSAPSLAAANCTTIWHGKVIPCNGVST